MDEQSKREAGVSIVKLVLLLVVVVSVGAVGWYVYNLHHTTTAKSDTISSTAKPVTSSPTTKATAYSRSSTDYLTIKEWGVRVPYSGTDTLEYSIAMDNSNLVWLNSKHLASADQNCEIVANSGNAGSVSRYLPSDNISQEGSPAETVQAFLNQDFAASNSQPPDFAKVGNYYYVYSASGLGCDTTASSNVIYNQTKRMFENLVKNFQSVNK